MLPGLRSIGVKSERRNCCDEYDHPRLIDNESPWVLVVQVKEAEEWAKQSIEADEMDDDDD